MAACATPSCFSAMCLPFLCGPSGRHSLLNNLAAAREAVSVCRKVVTRAEEEEAFAEAPVEPDDTKVTLRYMSGNVAAEVPAKPSETILQLKERAREQDPCIRPSRTRLVGHNNDLLPDTAALASCGLAAGHPLTLTMVVDAGHQWNPVVHGSHATIAANGRLATRSNDTFYQAIVVCDTPTRICRIRVVQVEPFWSGSLEVGFVQQAPDELDASQISEAMNALDVPGALASSSSTEWNADLKEGDILEFELLDTDKAVVRYRGQTFEVGSARRRFSTWKPGADAYPLIGIYGKTKAIELLP